MDRLFLDANVLFSAAYRPDAGLVRLWHLEDCALLSSGYAIQEAQRNLDQFDQFERLTALLEAVQRIPSVSPAREIRGSVDLAEKDWPILGGAWAAGASHLITGDRRDFGPYFGTELLGVLVLPPADCLARKGYGSG